MKYNFDEIIDRGSSSRTFSSKWERYSGRFEGYKIDEGSALSMWVADMDFRTLPEVTDALHKRVDHGIFGYSNENTNDEFRAAACRWYERRYGWQCRPEWMLFSMGLVSAINAAIQEFTKPGDGVIIQPPVYYPFAAGPKNNDRLVEENTLIERDGVYTVDFDNLEQLAAQPSNTMLILCSPHNPVGRVWTEDELRRILEICRQNNVMVFCDEIHADLIMPSHSFYSCGRLSEYYDLLILAHSPSKSFNLAGLTSALLTVPNEENRKRLAHRIYDINRIPTTQNFGPIAGAAAYDNGDDFVDEVNAYIAGNIAYAEAFLKEKLPMIKMSETQGTYLIWFDFRATGLAESEIYRRVLEDAKVIGDLGSWFGKTGAGFMRFNYACPRAYIKEQMERLLKAFS